MVTNSYGTLWVVHILQIEDCYIKAINFICFYESIDDASHGHNTGSDGDIGDLTFNAISQQCTGVSKTTQRCCWNLR